MIPSHKSALFHAFFSRHARSRIFGAFSEVRAHGVAATRALAAEAPLLVVSNHTSWWDPLVSIYLCAFVLRVDGYAMMDATNLRRVPFFGRVGAFGVDLDDPADGARAIRYAAKLLDRPGRLVWVFAQGRERPITERPIVFRGGTAEIARVAKHARVVPMALRYEFGSSERPVVYLSFGEPLAVDRNVASARRAQEDAVVRELDRIDDAICGRDASSRFDVIHGRGTSALSAFAERALAWLTK